MTPFKIKYPQEMHTQLIELSKENIAFEVSVDSMEPDFHKGDTVICSEIKREFWIDKLQFDESDFVIDHKIKGIMLKQIIDHNVDTGEIVCRSLNKNGSPDFTLNLREVDFLYNVVEHRIPGKKKLR